MRDVFRLLAFFLFASCATAAPSVESEEKTAQEAPPKHAAEKAAPKLDEACGDHPRFAALAGLEPRKVARLYMERCGLNETIELTGKLIEFPTVSAREPASGESFRSMASFLESWSKDAGLDFRVFGENDAWEIGYGKGAANVAFVMHGDVVPIDDGLDLKPAEKTGTIDAVTGEPLPPGWTKAPFRGTVEGDKLYGRGSEDDKGPIAAVLVTMRTMAKLGVETRGRVLAIIGTGEEHDWSGMKRYVDANQPQPAFVVSIDANFPVVIAESGFVAWQLSAPMKPAKKNTKKCTPAVEARGGQFLTQVPGEASMTLGTAPNESLEKLASRAQAAAAEVAKESQGKLRVELAPDAGRVKINVYGDAVHSSVADTGQNAIWGLAKVGERVGLCDNGVKTMLSVVNTYFVDDHWGEKLKLGYDHPTMGKLLVSPTMLRVEAGEAKLSINMRRPAGVSSAAFSEKLAGALGLLQKTIDPAIRQPVEAYVGDPAMANLDGPLVPTLIAIYRKESGDNSAQPISIRGGTYARLYNGAVSFGPSLPGRPYRGHAPDEYVELEALSLLDRSLYEATIALDLKAAEAGTAARPSEASR